MAARDLGGLVLGADRRRQLDDVQVGIGGAAAAAADRMVVVVVLLLGAIVVAMGAAGAAAAVAGAVRRDLTGYKAERESRRLDRVRVAVADARSLAPTLAATRARMAVL